MKRQLIKPRKLTCLLVICMMLVAIVSCNSKTANQPVESLSNDSETLLPETTAEEGDNSVQEEYKAKKLSSIDEPIKMMLGNWEWKGSYLAVNGIGQGNQFAITDIYTSPKVAFSVEADVIISNGQAAGIVFGVLDREQPYAHWYCANIDKTEGVAKLFSGGENTSLLSNSNTRRTLSKTEKTSTSFHVELSYEENGMITYKLNGTAVARFCDKNFSGGYIGFNSHLAVSEFRNVKFKVGKIALPMEEIILEVGDQSDALDFSICSATLELGETVNEAFLRFTLPTDYVAQIGDLTYTGGTVEHRFLVRSGKQVLPIFVKNGKGDLTAFTLVIQRALSYDEIYTDFYRPQYHFSVKKDHMNDPNGLVYNATTGEYHLFYQYSPDRMMMGGQVWGHAVSKDLVCWTELGIAIDREPDGGKIYSGSAVIDYHNTTGFFTEDIPPASRMVIMYTVPGSVEKLCLAYSLDDGYTWIKYTGNPVLSSYKAGNTFRDPKVLWIEDPEQPNGGLWMVVVGGTEIRLYTSSDLVHWRYNSTIKDLEGKNVSSECPELYRLSVDGNENKVKWVYSGAGLFYIVGDLIKDNDGTYSFVATQKTDTDYVFDTGRRYYAVQSFFNTANGDAISIAWCRDGYEVMDKTWVGCMTLPYRLGLKTMSDGTLRLTHEPIENLSLLKGEALLVKENVILEKGDLLPTVHERSFALQLKLKLEKNTSVCAKLFGDAQGNAVTLILKSNEKGEVIATLSTTAIAHPGGNVWSVKLDPTDDGVIDLAIYGDASIIEVFLNGGCYAFCDRIFPNEDADAIDFTVVEGMAELIFYECVEMKSAWYYN